MGINVKNNPELYIECPKCGSSSELLEWIDANPEVHSDNLPAKNSSYEEFLDFQNTASIDLECPGCGEGNRVSELEAY